ncbi:MULTISPECIES: polysaccharide biosynthesis tyrosine autokinase [Mesorhizobium]|uniref:Polysaccharide biosynthesis tyrosine autokinase n=9 Tax=Mesorhizobium TaxID=68287 RepID=A0AB38T8R3_9HYPH|nr:MULTISPECIES: polysaccharide biosynthesis tyrosine autokinase [Mesorhizobium]MDF3216013.1 polysaccharide biosynthesis tyrosine autokinase [Mesorhizobium ciceri]RUY70461.1 polysaccharide biosynthesis tyrosine autokinase [Mesorhizobium sp. M7A.F.Ca.CA.001.13.1.1]RUZ05565.1 polysaccharide biosynthesis tyrosine autokinase [Mesorhizobium sp. M7A.F.Ca.CA.001.04.2.1]RUZ28667.1 polysaccharide biosynthesis tyrosine autokinase [Mesorhizobium sp. M7A.F.Ca.US.007.01.2.1]RUZ36651.1 polysaccharide biosyn
MLDRNRQPQLAGPGHGQALSADSYYDVPQNYGPYGRDYAGQDEGFNPLKLLLYIVQYRWLIVMMAAAGLVAGVIVTMMQTPKYQATTQLEVLVPSAKVFQDIEVVSENSDVRAFLTAREKLKSRALAQRVVFQLGLGERPDFLFPTPSFSPSNIVYRAFGMSKSPSIEEKTPEEREAIAIKRIQEDLTVNLVTNTSLLSITFVDQKPKYASDVANQVAQSFIDQRLDQTSETSDLARQFIQEQVLQVKQKLQTSEKELVTYAKDAGITVTGDDKSLIGSNIEALNTALATAIQERLDAGRVVDQIEKGRGSSLGPVLESEGLQKLSDKLADLTSQYQQKLGILKPGFPEMQQLQSQIKELQRLYNNGVLAITDSLRLKYQEAQNKETDLKSKLAEMERQQVVFNDKNIKYTILKREVDSNRSQYDSLIAKLNEVGVSSELKTQSAAIVDFASLPTAPYSPRLSINLAVALALFMALAASIIYIIELLNNTFTNPEQIEKELGLTMLGILPLVGDRELIASIADQKSGLSEAYRSLRTSLQFSGAEGAPRSLLVTSSEPSEGKSTTSFKLGQDFAALGARVLLVDGDLRKPNLHRLFGLDNAIGLSNLLTNTVRKDDLPGIFRPTKYPNVTVLTSGTIPPNPADLLSSPKMALILTNLGKRFDLVIIDAPPVVGLSDAPILSRLAEGTLMVVSTNQVTRKSAKTALKRLRSAGANVIGAAMSKFTVNKFDYNYAYKYMNYQYYDYGASTPKIEGKVDDGAGQPAHAKSPAFRRLVRRLRSGVGGFVGRAKSAS